MTRTGWRLVGSLICLATALLAGPAGAAADLYAVASDGNGVGRTLTRIVPAGPGTAIGDGSMAINGGLAWSAGTGTWLAIENDSAGRSNLISFSAAAPSLPTSAVSLGSGFMGGLAFGRGGTLFAIGADVLGQSTLYTLSMTGGPTRVGDLGFGFMDLAFDSADGNLYALSANVSGTPRTLQRLTLVGGGVTTRALFSLGDGSVGFLGGMTWDADASRFLAIGSDTSGQSTLFGFDLSGAGALASVRTLGPGYLNGGLAFASSVPEPAMAGLMLAGLACLASLRTRVRTRSSLDVPSTLSGA